MSPDEYKLKVNDFTEALRKRCAKEGVPFQVVSYIPLIMQYGNNCTFYQLGDELYYLRHTGDQVNWDFIGVMQ